MKWITTMAKPSNRHAIPDATLCATLCADEQRPVVVGRTLRPSRNSVPDPHVPGRGGKKFNTGECVAWITFELWLSGALQRCGARLRAEKFS